MEEVSSSSGNKRLRSDPEESPEAKRIRADVLDILAYDDDETDFWDHGSADEEVACVMQSLQEEISVSLPATMPTEETVELPDLDYLLEASDDELGLPPTVVSTSGDAGSVREGVGEVEEAGYGQTWGFGDEVHTGFYDDSDFQSGLEAANGVVMFGDGQFQYDDPFSGSADFFDGAWRSDSLPAM